MACTDSGVKPTFKSRYRFLKPKPSILSRSVKPSDTVSKDSQSGHKNDVESNQVTDSDKNVTIKPKEETVTHNESFVAPKEMNETQCTLEETQILPQITNTSESSSAERGIKRLLPTTTPVTSEVDYPAPPPSPSKINRARIKAIPRFDNRRASLSASESEDESRKNSRNRNDSVCSSTSGVPENAAENLLPQKGKEYATVSQKKWRRTEHSRKLAEAKREFHLKFGKNQPTRNKLTMIDLIFYNPKTNPMHSTQSKQVSISEENEDSGLTSNEKSGDQNSEVEKINENGKEDEDVNGKEDGNENGKEDENDDENDVPAPQITLDAEGNIILDEKSLVYESKKTKRSREELQQAAVVDGDKEGSYGIYRRAKRSKGWTKDDTRNYYKALNTIGTDFSLMCDLFPNRTRRELKIKFNKEERINRALVDRALLQPCAFDFKILQQEILLEEQERKAREEMEKFAEEARRKEREGKHKEKKVSKISREAKMKKLTAHAEEASEVREEAVKKSNSRKRKKTQLSISSILDDCKSEDYSDAEESTDSDMYIQEMYSENEDSDDEIIVNERPTRYGRIPRRRKTYEPELKSFRRRTKKKVKVEEPPQYEPGSIMVVASKGDNGEPVYNIMMVTPELKAEPVEINSHILESLTQAINMQNDSENEDSIPGGLRTFHAQNILKITARPLLEQNEEEAEDPEVIDDVDITVEDETEEIIEENNYTVCHDVSDLQGRSVNMGEFIVPDMDIQSVAEEFSTGGDQTQNKDNNIVVVGISTSVDGVTYDSPKVLHETDEHLDIESNAVSENNETTL